MRGQLCDKLVLKPGIGHFTRRHLLAQVIPVSTADHGCRIVADRQPGLGAMALFQIVRCARAAHFRRHPAGIDDIAQHVRPATGEGKGEGGHAELAFAIGGGGVPAPLLPVDVAQGPGPAVVHAAAEIDQMVGPLDQRRQDIGCQRVDGEDRRMAFGRGCPTGRRIDTGIVDHSVHAADSVHLIRDGAGQLHVPLVQQARDDLSCRVAIGADNNDFFHTMGS